MMAVSDHKVPSVPFRSVLFSAIALWAAYFVIITVRAALGEFEFQQEMLVMRALVTLVGVIMTLVLWSLLRLFDNRPLWVRVAAALIIAIPAAGAIAQVNQWAFKDLQAKAEEAYGRDQGINLRRDEAGNLLVDVPVEAKKDWKEGIDDEAAYTPRSESIIIANAPTGLDMWRQLIDIALGRYFLLLAWASLYFALLAGEKARLAERREQEFRSAAKAAEIRSLRYQVNPHFLFNTLNSLSALVMTGQQARAEQMIQTISSFYRHSLAAEPTADVPLDQEFDLQRHYLTIEGVRFPDRLKTKFDLPRELEDARVPGMILQPLIENSVKYAVSAVNRPITITVSAREEFDRLVLTVSDDGPGTPDGSDHGFGIGLANVRDRLEARFGNDIAMTCGPVPGGYRSEIRVPLTRSG
ncbi:sensor histidine kinase [Altererythrobacter lutimaris]|uniref:Histidine kinase n=1 Tax=Altererythrobacter lutimaris TaxID=2743979 RepID=A0A850HC92_9SPHN|nr:histidine kinase [Altererythrobacter lutimaris]NVE95379.1 histidine kinase [Altererythrobacter lutimaris]